MIQTITTALDAANILYVTRDADPETTRLADLYLPTFQVHVIVAEYHTERTSKTAARFNDAIVIQGQDAATAFARLIGG